jgi:protein gp37
MGEITEIQWCDCTWSPWLGCSKVSAGWKFCYITLTAPFRTRHLHHGDPGRRTSRAYWRQPLRWNSAAQASGKRPRVFPSLCDWLDAEVPIEWAADFLKLVYDTQNLDWLLLTKRPENCLPLIAKCLKYWCMNASRSGPGLMDWIGAWACGKPPKNVWLGVSVENQEMADLRIPQLLKTPGRIRFLSMEPLLAPIVIQRFLDGEDAAGWNTEPNKIDWVIVGGETGPNARPCHIDWIRDVVIQCVMDKVPCFVKQLGANIEASDVMDAADYFPGQVKLSPAGGPNARVRLKHKKGADPAEWPLHLLVRQFPK